MSTENKHRNERLWKSLVTNYTLNAFLNLNRVNFDTDGKMNIDKYSAYAFHLFPNIYTDWKNQRWAETSTTAEAEDR